MPGREHLAADALEVRLRVDVWFTLDEPHIPDCHGLGVVVDWVKFRFGCVALEEAPDA